MLNKTTELMHMTFTVSTAPEWGRGWDLRQFGVNYRASPITVDERGESDTVDPYRSGQDGSVHAGDRACDAPGMIDGEKKTLRLFDLFSPTRHTILVFSNPAGAKNILESLDCPEGMVTTAIIYPQGMESASSADYTFMDGDGFAYKHYNVEAGETWAVVVRPDGYIGAIAKDVSGLRKYFDRILV